MNTYWKTGLLAGVSLSVMLGAAFADDAAESPDTARQLDTVIVLGAQQTYSSAETTQAMALQQSPVTSPHGVQIARSRRPGLEVGKSLATTFTTP